MFHLSEGASMAIFFGGEKVEAVLFSPLQGKLTFEGKPASDAKINLWIKWKDSEGETFSYTADEDGMFSIPEHTATYKQSAIAQLVIVQKIMIEYRNNSFEIWNLSKMEPGIFTELGVKPKNVICELTSELTTVRGDGSLGGVACKWES
jgi:hypothetical protein